MTNRNLVCVCVCAARVFRFRYSGVLMSEVLTGEFIDKRQVFSLFGAQYEIIKSYPHTQIRYYQQILFGFCISISISIGASYNISVFHL